ncbi:MAG: hypothetical protein AB1546_06450 [bacterium]
MEGRRFLLVVAFAAVAALIAGVVMSRIFHTMPAIAQAETITANEMVLVDSDGDARVIITASGEAPMPSIYFYSKKGTPLAGYGLSEANQPMIIMNNAGGEMRLALGVTDEGGPGILIKNKDGKNVWKAP